MPPLCFIVSEQLAPRVPTGHPPTVVFISLLPSSCYATRGIRGHGEQKIEGAEPSPVGARSSDAVEKRRKDKMLIARMLDMDEPLMTEKVTQKALKSQKVQAVKRKCIHVYTWYRSIHIIPGISYIRIICIMYPQEGCPNPLFIINTAVYARNWPFVRIPGSLLDCWL